MLLHGRLLVSRRLEDRVGLKVWQSFPNAAKPDSPSRVFTEDVARESKAHLREQLQLFLGCVSGKGFEV